MDADAGSPAPRPSGPQQADSSSADAEMALGEAEHHGGGRKRQKILAGMLTLHDDSLDPFKIEPPDVHIGATPADEGDWRQQVVDWGRQYFGTKSGKLLDTQKVYEGRTRELPTWRG